MNATEALIFKNPNLSFDERADDLVSRMTLKEKISLMVYKTPAIKRLGIFPYDWWNECLHGVGRAGIATVFPQAIGLAATFNPDLIFKMATVISDEARAKHHEFFRNGDHSRYKGLTYWSPNINIFRDPRWGRGQETYGEDPYLTGRIGVQFIKGLQGDDPKYLKLVATPKHYVVHSGPEKDRHHFNAIVNKKDLMETYMPHFKECIVEAKAESIMGAYNRTNGELCCASPTYLEYFLRKQWGFKGYVVSDCGAIKNFHWTHKVTKKAHESAALAVNNGCDLDCGYVFKKLKKAEKKGLISEETITKSLKRLMVAWLKLGMFDPPELVKYQQIPIEINDCAAHRKLALEVARQTIVLLKNENRLLPLKKNLKTIAVIGPNAHDYKVLLGNYNGTPSKSYTPLDGIKSIVSQETEILYEKGCSIKGSSGGGFEGAITAANKAEVVIMCMGISQKVEGEQKQLGGDDRKDLELFEIQKKLLSKIHNIGKPIILILLNGSPIAVPWANENIPVIIEAWYPGEEGGNAIAEILFGDYSPSGRLPITIVKSTSDLPPFNDYSMKGRTYRYIEKEPLYPFGYGLSFVKFEYSNLKVVKSSIKPTEFLELSVDVKNMGNMKSEEVIQLYIKDIDASVVVPHHSLRRIKRITLDPNESKTIKFTIKPRDLALINDDGDCILEPGKFIIYIGGCQPDSLSKMLSGNEVLECKIEVVGSPTKVEY